MNKKLESKENGTLNNSFVIILSAFSGAFSAIIITDILSTQKFPLTIIYLLIIFTFMTFMVNFVLKQKKD